MYAHLSQAPSCAPVHGDSVSTLALHPQCYCTLQLLLCNVATFESQASAPGDEWNVALAWYFPLSSLTPPHKQLISCLHLSHRQYINYADQSHITVIACCLHWLLLCNITLTAAAAFTGCCSAPLQWPLLSLLTHLLTCIYQVNATLEEFNSTSLFVDLWFSHLALDSSKLFVIFDKTFFQFSSKFTI